MEPASKRPTVSAADAGIVVSPDVLWEILLRVPAKRLCCFRAACRLWRSLLSKPSFVKAHAALRPNLILALAGENDSVDVMDLSGNVVGRIRIAPKDVGMPRPHPGPFYLLLDRDRVRVVDPDTCAVATLPVDHLQRRFGCSFEASYALGRVASTGQHKVLRVVTRDNHRATGRIEQHCDVLTLGDDSQLFWRPVASAPLCVEFDTLDRHNAVAHNAVVKGVVYFLQDRKFPSFDIFHAIETNRVIAFDLQAEAWRSATLPGPPAIGDRRELKLAKLNGSLAMLCHSRDFHDHPTVEIDVWFATDLEKGVWVKEHSIRLELSKSQPWMFASDFQLLTVLDDGRLVFYYSGNYSSGNSSPDWRTRIYDPSTKSCTDIPLHGVRYVAGMYRESMLLESQ